MPMLPNPWVLLGAITMVVALCVGSFFYGKHVQGDHDKAVQLAAVEKAAELTVKENSDAVEANTRTDTAGAAAEEKTNENFRAIEQKARIVIKKVPVHDRLPVGTVRVLNGAAGDDLAQLSAAPGVSDDATSEVDLPALTFWAIDNLRACATARDEVMTWQRWYPEQKAIWDAYRAKMTSAAAR